MRNSLRSSVITSFSQRSQTVIQQIVAKNPVKISTDPVVRIILDLTAFVKAHNVLPSLSDRIPAQNIHRQTTPFSSYTDPIMNFSYGEKFEKRREVAIKATPPLYISFLFAAADAL